MKPEDEFYVGYTNKMGRKTKRTITVFMIVVSLVVLIGVFAFSYFQKPFVNSTFELNKVSTLRGVYHENPYPMLRVQVAENSYKNILLLGFGKSSVNPFIRKLMQDEGNLHGKTLSLEGNLIYYNGKTLIQITNDEKVSLVNSSITTLPENKSQGNTILTGEIIDPKCYFGVMKPGLGKIHRSCAIRCISGGIPPVLATTDQQGQTSYYLLTNLEGEPLNQSVLPFIGKPALLKGAIEKSEDWNLLKTDITQIEILNNRSKIYTSK
ncbi:hypothetical protein [Lutimonas sp.]|uniref:hypothetical protein n=1 Tax=Lutimonas sp. TaxID=1872403 RepID=UPI003D9BED53